MNGIRVTGNTIYSETSSCKRRYDLYRLFSFFHQQGIKESMTFRNLAIIFALVCFSMITCSCARKPALPTLPVQGAPGEKVFRQAEIKFLSQEYPEAVQLFQDYINIYPDSPLVPSALMRIGAIYLVQNRYTEARIAYQKLIETAPESRFIPDARLGILTTYYHEDAYEELLNQAGEMDDHSLPKGI
ncbi:MAG: tetratricopeptide repeat protein, partial [Desulfobacteraceae bacterium]